MPAASLPKDTSALIFDLDGTLLDTEPLYTEATQKVLDPHGHTFTMALKRRVMGSDSRISAQITIDEFGLPMTPEEFLSERQQHLQALFPVAAEMADAAAFLHQASTDGNKIGLATSSQRHLCELKIGHRPWASLFDVKVCGDDAELKNSKPAPDIFLLCAERLAVEPAKAVAFEDSGNGVRAAAAAGMFVVGLRSPYTTDEDLHEADLLIDSFSDLIR